MSELIKEEIFTTVKKKRFIILTALLFIAAVIKTVMTKTDYWNDLTFSFAMQDYVWSFFDPFMGMIVTLAVYRRRYINSSILQAEKHSVKKCQSVIARAISGSIILACCYALIALFVILLGLIFGAHATAQQTGDLMFVILGGFFAAVASYISALALMYLIPLFSIFPVIWSGILMYLAPYILNSLNQHEAFVIIRFLVPKSNMDVFSTGLGLSYFRWDCIGILLLQIAVPLLLAILIFKIKKFKEKKPREKKGEANPSEDDEAAAVIAANVVV